MSPFRAKDDYANTVICAPGIYATAMPYLLRWLNGVDPALCVHQTELEGGATVRMIDRLISFRTVVPTASGKIAMMRML